MNFIHVSWTQIDMKRYIQNDCFVLGAKIRTVVQPQLHHGNELWYQLWEIMRRPLSEIIPRKAVYRNIERNFDEET